MAFVGVVVVVVDPRVRTLADASQNITPFAFAKASPSSVLTSRLGWRLHA